ncbi:MAG: macro domain-containing protein, partial [Pseudomonadota bacterium]
FGLIAGCATKSAPIGLGVAALTALCSWALLDTAPHSQSVAVGTTTITLTTGNITKQTFANTATSAIVNAAHPSLEGGGGIDGAIHSAAGPELLQECLLIPTTSGKVINYETARQEIRCPVGEARITHGGKLPTYIIHTPGPDLNDENGMVRLPTMDDENKLRSVYTNALTLAQQQEIRTIAFPSISTGIYSYPLEAAAALALETVKSYIAQHPDAFDEIRFVLFDTQTYKMYATLSQSAQ